MERRCWGLGGVPRRVKLKGLEVFWGNLCALPSHSHFDCFCQERLSPDPPYYFCYKLIFYDNYDLIISSYLNRRCYALLYKANAHALQRA